MTRFQQKFLVGSVFTLVLGLASAEGSAFAAPRNCIAEVKRVPTPESSYEQCTRQGEGRLNCNAYGGDQLSALFKQCEAIKDYCCDGYSQSGTFSRACITAGEKCLTAEKGRIERESRR